MTPRHTVSWVENTVPHLVGHVGNWDAYVVRWNDEVRLVLHNGLSWEDRLWFLDTQDSKRVTLVGNPAPSADEVHTAEQLVRLFGQAFLESAT